MGKAYANRKPEAERNPADFYETPKSLVWELQKTGLLEGIKDVWEPACGQHSISDELKKFGMNVKESDLMTTGEDFFSFMNTGPDYHFDAIITNPPFSKFDDFVAQAKQFAPKIFMIGKTNFLGAHSRTKNKTWEHLKYCFVFDRQVEYRTPHRDDGQFHVGCLVTCWYVWDMEWNEDYFMTKTIDVNKYATLGAFKDEK